MNRSGLEQLRNDYSHSTNTPPPAAAAAAECTAHTSLNYDLFCVPTASPTQSGYNHPQRSQPKTSKTKLGLV